MSCSPLPNADAKIAPRGKTAKPHGTPMSHDGPSGVTRRAKVTAKRAALRARARYRGFAHLAFTLSLATGHFLCPIGKSEQSCDLLEIAWDLLKFAWGLVGNGLGLVFHAF